MDFRACPVTPCADSDYMKTPIKILLSTGTLYKKPPWIAAEIASRVGFDGVELVLGYGFQDSDGDKEIATTLKEAPILSLHAPFYRLRGWGKPFESLQKTILLAERHSIPRVTFHPPRWLDLEFGFYRSLNRIRNFQRSFGKETLVITMENMPVTHGFFKIAPYFFSRPASLVAFAEMHNLLITMDATHLGTRERDFIGDVDLLLSSGRVQNVHFSDYANGREHLFPGKGVLPLQQLLETLKSTGYNGIITLELLPGEIEGDFRQMVDRLSEALAFIQTGLSGEASSRLKETTNGI